MNGRTYPRPMPTLAEALAERDQARADLAAAHTREVVLREAVERVRAMCDAPMSDGNGLGWVSAADLTRALDGTDQQPGDAT